MSEPLTLDETIEVPRPLEEVFAYISAFDRIEEWDPGVASARRLTAGRPGVGTEFQVDMKAGFSLLYTVREFEPAKRLFMTVESRFFTAEEEILFAALPEGGTRVRYIATFRFGSVLAAAIRLYPQMMQRVARGTMAGMKEALEDSYQPPTESRALALADKLVLPGIWRFTSLGYRVSRRHWGAVSANLAGRRAVVTGATSGLGLACARELAELGAEVVLVGRDKARTQAACDDIRRETGNPRVDFELCDLSLAAQVHELCRRLNARWDSLDILVNNAGALFNPRQVTAEGFEQSFALLLLGPCILTEGLHPLLARSDRARVVNVSSGGMYTQKLDVDDLQSERGSYSGSAAYARAKRGLMILTEEWAREWAGDGIVVNAMHPGWADTPGVASALPGFYRATRCLLRSPEEGADTAVWLAAATEAGAVSGKFWLDREQHPSHLSGRTRESPQERAQFLQRMQELREATAGTPPGRKRTRRA